METGLRLLMRDGAVSLKFHPHLTPEQYAELIQIARRATTTDELRFAVKLAATGWGVDVECDVSV